MPNKAELIIRITTEGKVEIQGPIHDKFLCYAMLESARDAIQEYVAVQAKSAIIPANSLPDMLAQRRM